MNNKTDFNNDSKINKSFDEINSVKKEVYLSPSNFKKFQDEKKLNSPITNLNELSDKVYFYNYEKIIFINLK